MDKPAQHDSQRTASSASSASAETEHHAPQAPGDVTDVVLAEAVTGGAPSLPAPAPPEARPAAAGRAPLALTPGARVDDFEIVRLLGRGAFGHVYLARQVSLDRLVALKISANRGSEGRTMARLEHRHIVQVFSESVDAAANQRLLCMQLVPGVGLERVIAELHERAAQREQAAGLAGKADWNGAGLLAIIDRSASLAGALDPAALHDREALARMDAAEATAWFGGRLAEALDFAHHQGVLHRDIKPANILVNVYGQPLLADFNISSQPVGSEPSGEEMFGGTFAYMAPEHLNAFNPADPTGPEAVTSRSDLYSLGLVLQQLLAGPTRVTARPAGVKMAEALRVMADERARRRPAISAGPPTARQTLERTIARCLEPDPADRFASGGELAEQLEGCRRLRQAERQLPTTPRVFASVHRQPFAWLLLLVLVPQIIGSMVNYTYNTTQIVGRLTESQRATFDGLVFYYNLVVYPAAVLAFIVVVRPVWRCWRALARAVALPAGRVGAARRRALSFPRWVALLTAVGWFPGGLLFPLGIALADPPLEGLVAAHFVASFCLSGLVALAYSLCGAEFVVLRALYPAMWHDTRHFERTTRRELAPVAKHLGWIRGLAGSIPLLAAVGIILAGDADHTTFRWLVAGLVVLGMIGFHVASTVTGSLSQVVVALTNTKP